MTDNNTTRNIPLNKIADIAEGEEIIYTLTGEQLAELDHVIQLNEDVDILSRRLANKTRVAQATSILFIDRLTKSCERAETAEDRGKVIAVRKANNGTVHLVEADLRCLLQ